MNVFLVGFMGCGKTYWAQKLAAHLGFSYIDSDKEIERAENNSIANIFTTKGENYFREQETVWLKHFSGDNAVIAVGGGLPIFHNNMDVLKQKGSVLWINEPFELIYERIKNDINRPLLSKSKQELEVLFKDRIGVYSKTIEIKSPTSIDDFLIHIPNTKY